MPLGSFSTAVRRQSRPTKLARLGITGDVRQDVRGGSGGVPDFDLSNAGAEPIEEGRPGVAAGSEEFKDRVESATATRKLAESQPNRPVQNLTTSRLSRKTFRGESGGSRPATNTRGFGEKRLRQTQPTLAMYAGPPDAASKLSKLATMDDKGARKTTSAWSPASGCRTLRLCGNRSVKSSSSGTSHICGESRSIR